VKRNNSTIILGITGSIAAYKACELINIFNKDGFNIQAILTKEAIEFITPLTIQTLSGNKALQDIFELPAKWNPVHTSLADQADLILIAPASANLIGKLANGICDDLLTCVVFASKAPILIAPAMNENMYNHKVVRDNIERLKSLGYKFIGPSRGRLACGREGLGRLADVNAIVNTAKRLVK